MFKKLVLIAVVLTALLANASPAYAQGTYYVDTAYTGIELGTATQPFNTLNEAITAAQNNPDGGFIYTGTAPSNYKPWGFVRTVVPPGTGAPLSSAAMFILLALVSLILVGTGWILRRRSQTLVMHA
jgi:hypothetical protein